MPRTARCAPGGLVYHALNRAVARLPLFKKQADYEAFEGVIQEAFERTPIRILAYCVMPNHWHFVLWPKRDDELTEFLRWLTHTHTMRWHAHHYTSGTGHLYQGRFKSFPIQSDEHLLTVLRYVERNSVRANLVEHAEDWRCESAWRRRRGTPKEKKLLSTWPLRRPRNWLDFVKLAAVRSRIGGATSLRSAWDTIWRTAVGSKLRCTFGPGVHTPTPRSSTQRGIVSLSEGRVPRPKSTW